MGESLYEPFLGTFWGGLDFFDPSQKSLGSLKMSLKMAHKRILPPKKNYIPQFLKQRDINSYYWLSLEIHEIGTEIFSEHWFLHRSSTYSQMFLRKMLVFDVRGFFFVGFVWFKYTKSQFCFLWFLYIWNEEKNDKNKRSWATDNFWSQQKVKNIKNLYDMLLIVLSLLTQNVISL